MRRQIEALPARIVPVKSAFEVAGDRDEPAALGAHADRVELERRETEIVVQFPQFRQLLHERRNQRCRRVEVRQRIGDDKRLEAGQRIERHPGDPARIELLDVYPALVRQGHCRRAKPRRVCNREIDLVLCRHRAFECHAVRFGDRVADAVLDEVKALLLVEGGLQIGSAADEPGLALFADAAFEDGFYEHRPVLLDEGLDVLLAGVWAEHFGGRIAGELQQLCAVAHAGDFHRSLPPGECVCPEITRDRRETGASLRGFGQILNAGEEATR